MEWVEGTYNYFSFSMHYSLYYFHNNSSELLVVVAIYVLSE